MAVLCQNVIQTAWNMCKETTIHIVKWKYLPHILMVPHNSFFHNIKIAKVLILHLTQQIASCDIWFFLEIMKLHCDFCSLIGDVIPASRLS
jgi:hypothetical protein